MTLLRAWAWPTTLRIDERGSEGRVERGALSVIGLVAQSGAKFLINWMIGRVAGPLVLGTTAVAFSLAQLAALMGPNAVGAATSKYLALAAGEGDLERGRAIARHVVKLTLLLMMPLTLVTIGVSAWWLGIRGTGLIVMALMVTGLTGYAVTRGAFFGHRHVVAAGKWDLVTAVLAVLGTAAMLGLGVRGLPLLLPLALSYVIFSWAGWPRGAAGSVAPKDRREIRRLVGAVVIGSSASSGLIQGSLLAAQHWAGTAQAGLYQAAYTLALPLSILVGAGSQVMFPALAEAVGRDDRTSIRRITHAATVVVALGVTSAVGLLIVLSGPLVGAVWGERFSVSSGVLPIMLIAVATNAAAVPSVNAMTITSNDLARRTAVFSVIGGLTGIGCWLVLGPSLGIVGVAIGYAMGVTLTATINVAHMWISQRQPWAWIFARVALLLCGAVILERVARGSGVGITVVCMLGFIIAALLLCARSVTGALGELGLWRAPGRT